METKLYELKNRFTGEVIFSLECESFKVCVEGCIKAGISLKSANLEYANLESANLQSASLKYANLRSANLRSASLESANLKYANLEYANLKSANLKSANLEYANIDFSSWPIWCGSVKAIVCKKIARQLMYHALVVSMRHIPKKFITQELIKWVNESHIVKNGWVKSLERIE